jgi:Leucine-rich repeat (LRR) protein
LIQFLIEEDFYQIGDEMTKRGRDEKSTILYLSSIKMISLPLYLIEDNIITHLDLSNNYLTNLPNWFFDSMKNLTHLDLSKNYLNQLPEKFQELKKLKDLYLSFNQFEYFPPSIINLTSLQFLKIDNNHLIHIPNDIVKLRYTLYELDISNNKLIDLPDDLKIAKKLKLKATGNRFLYYTNFEIITKLLTFDDNKLTPTSLKRFEINFKTPKQSEICE